MEFKSPNCSDINFLNDYNEIRLLSCNQNIESSEYQEFGIESQNQNSVKKNLTYSQFNDSINFGNMLIDNDNKSTDPKTFLAKKTKRDNNNIIFENENQLFENNSDSFCRRFNDINLNENTENNIIIKEINSIEIKNSEEKKKKSMGRKSKAEKKKGNKGKHNNRSKDNIIRKIKTFFGKSLFEYLKNSFTEKADLLKLEAKINKSLKKDYNEKLFKTKLIDLLINTKISNKYKLKKVETNEKLMKKIMKDKREAELIKILDLTYLEAFNIFRRTINSKLNKKIEGTNIKDKEKFKDLDEFVKDIRTKQKKDGEKDEIIEEYIDDVKKLVYDFENWFDNKIGRERY